MFSRLFFISCFLLGALNVVLATTLDRPPYDPSKNKRGLTFSTPTTWIQGFCGGGTHVTWAYDWAQSKPDNFPGCLTYIPMLWDASPGNVNGWKERAQDSINKGANHILGFNEPDLCFITGTHTQACMTPQDAANAWRQHIQPFGQQAWLVSPAITNADGSFKWLKDFLAACHDCQVDTIAVHWYDTANNFGYLQSFLQSLKSIIGNKNIWLTEFNGRGSEDEQVRFLQQALPWMDHTDYIERYAWFFSGPDFTGGALTGWDGKPTNLGYNYGYAIPF
ncbi:hypothetical protein HYFRA_00007040 [Hymenoscyphus fraxineus]|uniref:Asl1-like glycosyl hydrolase catalytic domain-containing protein n=1 Tax=Hymenoscyphus fraxineus TaxID=746836 RepID=A0A9N9PPU1_9HELO|nr:hypothetical protein HYFRA_00007040 [Hymenoscyphus fraxineus]